MANKIILSINKERPKKKNWSIHLWFSHTIINEHIIISSPPPFPLLWGDKGMIPMNIQNTIKKLLVNNPISLTKKIIEIIHSHIATKWKLKFYALYNKDLSAEEICEGR